MVSIVVNRANHLTYSPPPDWLEIPAGARGVKPSLKGIDFDFRSVCHKYSGSPAIITAIFDDRNRVDIYISSKAEEVFCVITKPNRKIVASKAQAARLFPAPVNILPPIGPLARREKMLVPDYVHSSLSTDLAPIHFRNQLALFYENYFDIFVQLAEESW